MERQSWPDDFDFDDGNLRAEPTRRYRVDLVRTIEMAGSAMPTIVKINTKYMAEREKMIERHRRRVQRHLASRPGIAASGGRDRTDES